MFRVDVGDDAVHRLPAEPIDESSGCLGGDAASLPRGAHHPRDLGDGAVARGADRRLGCAGQAGLVTEPDHPVQPGDDARTTSSNSELPLGLAPFSLTTVSTSVPSRPTRQRRPCSMTYRSIHREGTPPSARSDPQVLSIARRRGSRGRRPLYPQVPLGTRIGPIAHAVIHHSPAPVAASPTTERGARHGGFHARTGTRGDSRGIRGAPRRGPSDGPGDEQRVVIQWGSGGAGAASNRSDGGRRWLGTR